MNKRIKKKKRNEYNWTTTKERKRNKEFCKKYPFMIPRDITGKPYWLRKPYDFVETFGIGWNKAFGKQLCEELREELIKSNYLYQFRFYQIKEKYGQLRIYHNGNREIDHIIDCYSTLSENICYRCGKPDVPMTNTGWLLPMCRECFIKEQKRQNKYRKQKLSDEEIIDYYNKVSSDDSKMPDSMTIRTMDKTITYDLRDRANKIRENFVKKMA